MRSSDGGEDGGCTETPRLSDPPSFTLRLSGKTVFGISNHESHGQNMRAGRSVKVTLEFAVLQYQTICM